MIMPRNPPSIEPGDALIVIDVQQDFCPGGALAVKDGDGVVPVLNRWIDTAQKAGAPVVASQDWHPPGHMSFRSAGGPWPTHCVQGSDGAAPHPDLHLPEDALIVRKGADPDREQYSAFDRTGLGETLRKAGIRRLWVGGLALDVCVRASVLDALKLGFEVHLIPGATRAVNAEPGDGERAMEAMRSAGAVIEPEAGDA